MVFSRYMAGVTSPIRSDGIRETLSQESVVASSSCLDPLTHNPLVKVKFQEPHPGPRKFYEGNASFLDEASDKSFGASKMAGGCSDVQEWSIDVFATGSLTDHRNFSEGWFSIHETWRHGKPMGLLKISRLVAGHLMPPSLACVATVAPIGSFSTASSNNQRRFPSPPSSMACTDRSPELVRDSSSVRSPILTTHMQSTIHGSLSCHVRVRVAGPTSTIRVANLYLGNW